MMLKFGKMGAAGRKARRTLATILAATPGSHWWDMRVPTAQAGWRRNLLGFSEDFSNAVWSKNLLSVTRESAIAPDGTNTGWLVLNTGSGFNYLRQGPFTVTSGVPMRYAVVAKAGTATSIYLGEGQNVNNLGSFNLLTGVATNGSATDVSMQPVYDGWYLCSATYTPSSSLVSLAITQTEYPGLNGAGTFYIWHPQLSLASVDQTYQKITDGYTEFLAAYPTTALYQDAAGTTAVTAVGQYLGLCLDKPAGSVAYGPELVGLTWSSTGATVTYVDGLLTAVKASGFSAYQDVPSVAGKSYAVALEYWADASNIVANSARSSYNQDLATQSISAANGTHHFNNRVVLATTNTMRVQIDVASGGAVGAVGDKAYARGISVKEVIGNPLTQSTTTKRPQLLGTPALPKFDGNDDALTTGAITLTSNMHLAAAIRVDASGSFVFGHSGIAGNQYLASGVAGNSGDSSAGCGSPSFYVDGVPVPRTAGAISAALTVGSMHIFEAVGCNLTAWADFKLSGYAPGWNLNGSIPEVVLTPALSDADRTIVRKELAAKYGIAL